MGEEVSVQLLPKVTKLVIHGFTSSEAIAAHSGPGSMLSHHSQIACFRKRMTGARAASLTRPCDLFQVGLFRKSGVKSRIHALRQMNESFPENVSYEDQSAYDVADMVKQFFRDLPEPLFTNKLSETFLHIYQCKWKPCRPLFSCARIHVKTFCRLSVCCTSNT